MDDQGSKPSSVPTFAALVNQRIVILSERTSYMAVDRHFLFECMRSKISRIRVDEAWYDKTYPDVAQAVMSGTVSRAKEHYQRFGYFENRMPYAIEVDAAYYLEAHPDVAEATRNGTFGSAQAHFNDIGYSEGRLPYPGFSLTLDG